MITFRCRRPRCHRRRCCRPRCHRRRCRCPLGRFVCFPPTYRTPCPPVFTTLNPCLPAPSLAQLDKALCSPKEPDQLLQPTQFGCSNPNPPCSDSPTQGLCGELKQELRDVLLRHGIRNPTIKPVRRSYAFEQPGVPHGEQYVLKVGGSRSCGPADMQRV